MSRVEKILLAVLVVILTGYIVFELRRPAPPDWRPTFAVQDKIPYGLYALDRLLPQTFTQGIQYSDRTLYETLTQLNDKQATGRNLISINYQAKFDVTTTRELLEFASRGNEVFISAQDWTSTLTDTLKLTEKHIDFEDQASAFMYNEFAYFSDTSLVSFTHPKLRSAHTYFPNPFLYSDLNVERDTLGIRVLGTTRFTSNTFTQFVKVDFGKGHIWFHTIPFAFTNIFLLKAPKTAYAFNVLSHLPNQPTIFDRHRDRIRTNASLTRVLLNEPALRAAWQILLWGVLLLVLIRAKRRQRAIPILNPPENTSLRFVRTMGRLYYRQKNHRDLAQKKITYFLENIRTQYRVQTHEFNDAFYQQLSDRTTHRQEEIAALFRFISIIRQQTNVSESELNELARRIDAF